MKKPLPQKIWRDHECTGAAPSQVNRRLHNQPRLLAALLFFTLSVLSLPATAQSPLSEGTQRLEQGQYDEALRLLLPEYANAPDAVLAYTIARCYEGLKDDPRSLRFYSAALSMRRGLTRDELKRAKKRRRSIKKRLRKRPKKGMLTVNAPVVGAVVRLDGVEIGRSPLSGVLIRPGPHRVRLEHPYWEPWETRFSVNVYESVTLKAEMRDKPTDVLINTQPAGAKAKVSGTEVECITPCLVPLRKGKYQLMVVRAGYDPIVHDFVKEPGKLKEVRLQLTQGGGMNTPSVAPTTPIAQGAPSNQGIIRLDITPPGAQIAVNGVLRGSSPLTTPLMVQPGVASVEISMAGYKTWTARVQVTPGGTTALRIQLVPGRGASNTTSMRLDDSPPSGSGDSTTGWALLGTGLTLSVGGALMVALPTVLNGRKIDLATRFEIQGQQYISSVTRQQALDLEDQAKLWSYIGYGTIGVGVGLTIAGAVLAAQADHSPDDSADATLRPSVSPVLIPGGGGASATWRF